MKTKKFHKKQQVTSKKRHHPGKRKNRTKAISRIHRRTSAEKKYRWAIKGRLYPTKVQASQIRQHCGARRFIWNQLLEFAQNIKKETNFYPSDKELTEFFNSLKNKFVWLKLIHSKMQQQVLIDFKKAIKDFIKGLRGEPTFKKKKNYDDSCRLPVDAFRYVKGNQISFTKTIDQMHFKCSRKDERLLNRLQKDVCSTTLHWHPDGSFSFSILIKADFLPKHLFNKREEFIKQGGELTPEGCDLGLKDLLITSEGKKYKKIDLSKEQKWTKKKRSKADKKRNRSYKVWSKLPKENKDEKYKNSKRVEVIRHRSARAARHEANIRENKHHKIANELNIIHNVLAFEDLAVKNLMKNHKLARSFANQGLYSLFNRTRIKAEWLGNAIVQVGRKFPSSKKCFDCGYKMDKMPLDVREWVCPICGHHHDRDINAAKNIKREGLRLLEEEFKQSGTNCESALPLSSGEVKRIENPLAGTGSNEDLSSYGSVKCERNVKLKIQTAGYSRVE